MPKVYFASDHAGLALKSALVAFVEKLGYEATDLGAYVENPSDDYPDFIEPCALRIVAEPGAFAVILGGSGQGEAMVANRIAGVRAAVFYGGSLDIPKLAREHNDANVLSLGARFVTEVEAKEAVKVFLETRFTNDERHVRRLAKF